MTGGIGELEIRLTRCAQADNTFATLTREEVTLILNMLAGAKWAVQLHAPDVKTDSEVDKPMVRLREAVRAFERGDGLLPLAGSTQIGADLPAFPTADLGWHVICGERLLDLLRRARAGEDADLLYTEEWANADHQPVEGRDDLIAERDLLLAALCHVPLACQNGFQTAKSRAGCLCWGCRCRAALEASSC